MITKIKFKRTKLICLILTVMMVVSLLVSSNVAMVTDATCYTLSYDANGGYGAPCYQSVSGYCYLSNIIPLRSGYSCLGWATSCTSSIAQYKPSQYCYISCNTKLYAVWQYCGTGGSSGGTGSGGSSGGSDMVMDWQVTLTYDANGGSGAPPKQTFWVQAGTYISYTVPTRSGYTFVGWTVDKMSIPPASGPAGYQPGDFMRRTADITLYAMWRANVVTYTLSYDANGGSGAPGNQTINGAGSLYVSYTQPVRTNYIFLGWSTSSTAISSSYAGGNPIYISGNVILYAVWQYNPPQTYYSITYDANGGSNAPPAQTGLTANAYTTVSFTQPTRTNYIFLGWSTDSTASYPSYVGGSYIFMDSNKILYAVWQYNPPQTYYSITYDANGGSGAPPAQTGLTANTYTTVSFTQPTRTNYIFWGWSTDSTAPYPSYVGGSYILMDSNKTLYAVWYYLPQTQYTLKYDANGGSDAPASQSIDYMGYLYISPVEPTRYGYTFLGWAFYSNATLPIYFAGDAIYMNSNITLYAVWAQWK